jgi:carbamoyl-phosphate synthase large subunit
MAMKRDWSVDHIHKLTRIDKWFLYKLRNIIHTEKFLSKHVLLNELKRDKMLAVKKYGFSDLQIARAQTQS